MNSILSKRVSEKKMMDLISRQKAIDALDEIEAEVAEGFGFEYEKWRKYFCDLPPAQPDVPDTNVGDMISRAKAIEALMNALNDVGVLDAEDINTVFQMLPPAQPKRGRWIGKYPVTSVCSECGFLIHDSKVKAFAYCPNCGAEMREVTT